LVCFPVRCCTIVEQGRGGIADHQQSSDRLSTDRCRVLLDRTGGRRLRSPSHPLLVAGSPLTGTGCVLPCVSVGVLLPTIRALPGGRRNNFCPLLYGHRTGRASGIGSRFILTPTIALEHQRWGCVHPCCGCTARLARWDCFVFFDWSFDGGYRGAFGTSVLV
jgi:hypothetical protein